MLKNSTIMRFPDLSRYRNYDDASIESDDIQLINSIIGNQSDWISGNNINILENLFKKYLNIKYAFSFSHGRVALSAILKALNLSKGDEVILPAYTCVVVPNSIIFEKLTPVYCDIELETLAPSFSASAFASALPIADNVPVKTTVLPVILLCAVF